MIRQEDQTALSGADPSVTNAERVRADRLIKPEIAADYMKRGAHLADALSHIRKMARELFSLLVLKSGTRTRSDF